MSSLLASKHTTYFFPSASSHTFSHTFSHSFSLLTLLGLLLISLALHADLAVFHTLPTTLTHPIHSAFNMPHSSKTVRSPKPPSKRELGQASWTLIHSIAANYSHTPTANDQYHAKAFLRSIAKLYPCKRCRQHFDKYIAAAPPDLSNRDGFVLWACSAHNAVNRRQNKEEFPCRMADLDRRWGDCGCKLKSRKN